MGSLPASPTVARMTGPAGSNWAGSHIYRARALHRPTSVEQVQELVAGVARIRVLGSRHSFTGIVDSDELVSLVELADIAVDRGAGTVSVGAGVTYGALARRLAAEGLALHNLASLPHISVAGAVATATHGSGVRNGNLATAVAAMEMVTSDGELLRIARGERDFDGMVVGLGALGAVTRLTLDVEPAFDVAQRVFEALPWDALTGNLDEVLSAGYSVSVFTRWQETVDQVWIKSRVDQPERTELFGARPATVDRHPILELDPAACTPQLGRPGAWSDRLPHFRMGFTPSAGEEIQSEYLLPRSHAAAAIDGLRGLAERIRPLLLVCEIRTVAADELWMSTSQGRDSVAFHFTWRRLPDDVARVVVDVEDVLAPFVPRPHWGKLFAAGAADLAPRYERHADFARLVGRLDPRGAFRNAWLEERVLGSAG
jgi:xylitol oxidase